MRKKISFALTMLAVYALVGLVVVATWLAGPQRRTKETCHN